MAGYDAEKMRALLRKQMGGRSPDPNEFKPPKAVEGQLLKFRFYILPPIEAGDIIVGGTADKSMDTFAVTDGQHWADKRPTPCPRVISNDELECDMCTLGFKLKAEAKASKNNSDALQAALSKQWLPQTTRLINIWFPPVNSNPEELRDKVMFLKTNQTLFGKLYDTFMRDDAGQDEDDPMPFGAFFDENNALLFNLVISKDKKSGYNNYDDSKFIVKDKNGNSACGPIVRKADGSPDVKAIKAILARRHDLFSKIEPYDVAAVSKLAKRLLDAADGDDGFDQDENASAKKPSSKPAVLDEDDDDDTPAPPKASTKSTPKPATKVTTPADDDDDDEDLEPPASEVLSGESPLGDDDEDVPAVKNALPKSNGKAVSPPKANAAKKAPAPEPEPDDEGDVAVAEAKADPELNALLGQLSDNDD